MSKALPFLIWNCYETKKNEKVYLRSAFVDKQSFLLFQIFQSNQSMFTKSNETETTKNSNETEPTEATFYLFFQEIFRASSHFLLDWIVRIQLWDAPVKLGKLLYLNKMFY